jgi:VIT1/CCC1 family predicted Fe2+/Mn2+ transporter
MSQQEPAAHVPPEDHHRRMGDGAARAAVFGVSDGLVSNLSMILAVAGGSSSLSLVRLAGLAGLFGGAFSMAAGEYVSMRAQSEFLQRELEIERRELERNPAGETRELAAIYRNRGVPDGVAMTMATAVMRDPLVALDVHAREELGVDPDELGAPVAAAAASFVSFALGAFIPLLPWFVANRAVALGASVALAVVAAAGVGAAVGMLSGRRLIRSAARQIAVLAACGAVTYLLGTIVGVGST